MCLRHPRWRLFNICGRCGCEISKRSEKTSAEASLPRQKNISPCRALQTSPSSPEKIGSRSRSRSAGRKSEINSSVYYAALCWCNPIVHSRIFACFACVCPGNGRRPGEGAASYEGVYLSGSCLFNSASRLAFLIAFSGKQKAMFSIAPSNGTWGIMRLKFCLFEIRQSGALHELLLCHPSKKKIVISCLVLWYHRYLHGD